MSYIFAVVRSRRVVLAPDKFKGSLSAAQVAAALSEGMHRAGLDVCTSFVPVADGGDGSLAVALASGYRTVAVDAAGPLGEPVAVPIAVRGEAAVIELASICGLQQLPGGHREPELSSTLGLGLAMRAALDAGYARLTVGLGGSSSTDGGAGMLCGLGARILDADGRPLPPRPTDMVRAAAVDLSGLHSRVRSADIAFAVDVQAPLLGDGGAAAVFGRQKGADDAAVERLEHTMRRWAEILGAVAPQADADLPGVGAAGGVAFAGVALGATLSGGADTFLDLVGFGEALEGADLVVTGEGRLDEQTLMGKAPAVIADRCAAAGISCAAVVGSRASTVADDVLHARGFTSVYELIEEESDVATSPAASRTALKSVGTRLACEHFLDQQPLLQR